ncbi:MAG: polyprenyl synthetase family protein [Alphaproteobacteria bacterium]|nr:polyprenyl synthetase family protein [Alphaproteobacteria bacterium]
MAAERGRNPLTAFYPDVRARMVELTPQDWPEMTRAVEQHITQFDFPTSVLLPLATCAAAGGAPEQAVGAAAALGFVLLGIRWLDDAADRDRPDGLWATLGPARSNLFGATALALAYKALARDGAAPRQASESMASHFVAMAKGQDSDIAGGVRSFDSYWALMSGKAGAAFAMACGLGAICAKAGPATVALLERFGRHLGVLLQILDDLEGCFRPTGTSDIEQGKVTLPVVYALNLEHERQSELAALVEDGALPRHAARVVDILEAAGAREYCVWAAIEERKRALAVLRNLPRLDGENASAGRDALASFLELPFEDLPELSLPATPDRR